MIIFVSNNTVVAISRKTVRMSPIDYIYLGLIVRYQADLQLLFFKNHIFWQAVNLCKLLFSGNWGRKFITKLSNKVNHSEGIYNR